MGHQSAPGGRERPWEAEEPATPGQVSRMAWSFCAVAVSPGRHAGSAVAAAHGTAARRGRAREAARASKRIPPCWGGRRHGASGTSLSCPAAAAAAPRKGEGKERGEEGGGGRAHAARACGGP